MSWFTDIFSPSTDTQQQTTSTQNTTSNNQSQGTSQSNLWPYLQPYFGTYANTAFNPGAFNANQTDAAARQNAVTGNLLPGFGAASTIASGGLSPTAYQPYMSQYTQSVIDPTVTEFERLNKSATNDINGNLAKAGALGNSNNAATRAAALAPVINNQKAQIAGLYDAGFKNATNTALQSQGQQLQGAGTLGSLTGAATGANTAGFNIGQTLWQNPLSWMTQGASGLSPFLQGAGNNTNQSSSGTATGTSTGNTFGTTTQNPSLFQIASGIGGLFTGFMPKAANGGAIMGYEHGGAVPAMTPYQSTDLPTKIAHAFEAFHGMRERARGGSIKGYDAGGSVPSMSDEMSKDGDAFSKLSEGGTIQGFDAGGTVGPWSTMVTSYNPSTTMGDDVVNQANANQFGSNLKTFGDKLGAYANSMDYSKDMAAASSAASNALASNGNQLSSFMQRYGQPAVQGFALGGTPSDDNDPGTVDVVNPLLPIDQQPMALKPFSVRDTGSFGAPYSVPQFKGLAPNFSSGIQSLYEQAQKDGVSLRPLSGYRDEAAQRRAIEQVAQRNGIPITPELYTRGIPGMAAPVGKSRHQHGEAMDWDVSDPATKQWLYENAPKYGFAFPFAKDSGHMQMGTGQPREAGPTAVASAEPSMEGRMSLGGPKEEPSFFGKLASALGTSPIGSGNWESGTGPLARTLLAMSGPLIGGPAAQQAGEMVKEHLAQRNADRLHQQMMAQLTGQIDGQPTMAAQQLAEQKRVHDAQLQRMDPGWGIEKSVDARIKLAPKFGLEPGSPEYKDWIGMGKLPMPKTQAIVDYETRYENAVKYAGKDWADSAEGRDYVLTGKLPKDATPRAETTFDVEIAKKSAADLEKRTEAVRDGQGKLQKLEQLGQVVANPDVYQGKGALFVNELKKWGTALGFPISGVADTEVMNSLSNQLALSLRSTAGGEGMPGALSDSDRKFLQSSVPSLTNTQKGNAAMVFMMQKAENYKIKANTEAMNYISKNRTNIGLPEYMTEWMKTNPMFTDEDRKRVSSMTGQRFDDLVPERSAPANASGSPKSDPFGIR